MTAAFDQLLNEFDVPADILRENMAKGIAKVLDGAMDKVQAATDEATDLQLDRLCVQV